MRGDFQMLSSCLSSGRVLEGLGLARTLVHAISPRLGPETALQVRSLLDRVETQEDGIRATHALAGAVLGEQSPDAYLPEAGSKPLSIVVAGGPEPDAVKRLVKEKWGPRIFEGARDYRRGPSRRFQDLLFDEMMADEEVQRRMIAFLDVAASCPAQDLAHYLDLYFPPGAARGSGFLRASLGLGTSSWVPDSLVSWGIRRVVRTMYNRFFVGETPEQAVAHARELQKKGLHATINVVQEHVVSAAEAKRYLLRNLELMRIWAADESFPAMTRGGVPVRHLSTKLSGLTERFDPLAWSQVVRETGERLLPIFQRARDCGREGRPFLIDVDPEDRYTRDLYFRIFWKTLTDPSLEGWDEAGIVVQAYLKDAESVLMRQVALARETGKRIQIRLVKGAYHLFERIRALRNGWEIPVLMPQVATDRNYERLLRLALLNHRFVRIVVATHNHRDIAIAESVREAMGLPPEVLEFDFLNGVGEAAALSVVTQGGIARMYTPAGSEPEGMPYEARRLKEVTPRSAIGETHVSGTWDAYFDRMEGRTQDEPPLAPEKPPFQLEPEADFSDGQVREAMREALDRVEYRHIPTIKPLIGEEEVPSNISRTEPSRNPANLHHVVGHVMQANEADADQAILAAQRGFKEWSSFTQKGRSATLRRAAELVRERRYEIAATMVFEAGKPWSHALADVNEGIDFLEAYAIDGLRESPDRAPLGVGVAISPFNFPFAIAMGEIAGGLALGNAMILKPANQTPVVGEYVVKILREAGVPKNAIQFLPGPGRTVGQRLVESELVDFAVFTGSKETADGILKTAAEHPSQRNGIKVVVAETGGKNPMIVDESADLDVAVEAILEGAFGMNGQRCSATSRVIVTESVAERLIERLIEGAKSMTVGNPWKQETRLGPQIDAASHRKARDYIEIGKREATLVYDSEIVADERSHYRVTPVDDPGFYVGPHIFKDVPRNSQMARDEIFAPILSVITAKDFDEALEIANEVPYGLTAGLISRNPDHIQKFLTGIQAGNAYVNRSQVGARVWEQPFGGAKDSGTGPKAGGRQYVARFGKPRREPDQGIPIHTFVPWAPQEIPVDEVSGTFGARLRASQEKWSNRPVEERAALLKGVIQVLSNDQKSVSATVADEIRRAQGHLLRFIDEAPKFVRPTPTLELPGEINEETHDWPLGVGYIWGNGEIYSDLVAAVAAALVMGNVVILPDSSMGQSVASYFRQGGFPPDLIFMARGDPDEILRKPWIDFAVAHGSEGPRVCRTVLASNRNRIGFKRFIGVTDDPSDHWYLTRFANARTLSERTLRHGADLNIRRFPETTG